MKLSKLQLIILLAIVLLGAAGFWLWQRNTYSKEVLKLEIIAPGEATMGEEITYTVRYKNNGEVRLESPVLIFEYPSGAVPSEGESTRLTRTLEDIYPGQERNLSFPARLFGRQGEVKEARAQVQYTPKNLNAQFESETTATTVIAEVPLTFELDLPSRMESGQQFTFDLNYFSNSSYPLSNIRITMEYPGGFTFKSANPSPIGESEWDIGLLNRTEGGRISLTGNLQGEVQESKLFKATIGMFKEGRFTLLKEVTRGVEITRTRLLLEQEVNGSPQYVASPGDPLHYVISFKNVSEKSLENLFLIVSLQGRPFDLSSVKPGAGGTFQQGDNSILFEADKVPRLRFLGTGEEGEVEFWVNVKEEWETFSPQDRNFALRSRVLLSDVTQDFEVKVSSGLQVQQRAFFEDEVFGNQGPLPPQAGSATTYTVLWQALNSYNDVQNAKVRAVLAPGVALTGNIFPADSSLTFDQASREVVWEIGELKAGTGPHLTPPSVAFQISFTPLSSQRGTVPQLAGEATVTADDPFTERSPAAKDAALDTALADDPSTTPAMGVVQ